MLDTAGVDRSTGRQGWSASGETIGAQLDSRNRLFRLKGELFEPWRRRRDGTLTHRGFQRRVRPIRQRIDDLLAQGWLSGNPRTEGMCRELRAHRDRLWRFVDSEGIEPTNNSAERALRPAVIWRKRSFGTQSAAGSSFIEAALSVVETCRQQGRDVLEFPTRSITAHFQRQQGPSLLAGV